MGILFTVIGSLIVLASLWLYSGANHCITDWDTFFEDFSSQRPDIPEEVVYGIILKIRLGLIIGMIMGLILTALGVSVLTGWIRI